MDITCAKCGEPWDSYGITCARGEGDMTLSEATRFLRRQGCPSCHFGKDAPDVSAEERAELDFAALESHADATDEDMLDYL